MEVVQQISEPPRRREGVPAERIEIKSVTIRDTPPRKPVPLVTDTPAELAQLSRGARHNGRPDHDRVHADKAPDTCGSFCGSPAPASRRHRLPPRRARASSSRPVARPPAAPLTEKQQKLVRKLQPEFNDTEARPGIVSMARGDDPASATTSFFIVHRRMRSSLDGKYTAFGRVVDGMAVVDAIEQAPVNGETPVTRIELKQVRILK